MANFNQYLSNLTEHYDMPKVSKVRKQECVRLRCVQDAGCPCLLFAQLLRVAGQLKSSCLALQDTPLVNMDSLLQYVIVLCSRGVVQYCL